MSFGCLLILLYSRLKAENIIKLFSVLRMPTNFIIFSSESREYNKIENIFSNEIHSLSIILTDSCLRQVTMNIASYPILPALPTPPATGYLPGVSLYNEEEHNNYEKEMQVYRVKMAAARAAQEVARAAARAAAQAAAQAAQAAQAAEEEAKIKAIKSAPRQERNKKPVVRMDL